MKERNEKQKPTKKSLLAGGEAGRFGNTIE
jgi:hypothetical protein